MKSWKYISGQKSHTQDGPVLVSLMKSVGRGLRAVRAVDIGCGDGVIASEILRLGRATHVVAFDISRPAVDVANENLTDAIRAGRAEVYCLRAQTFFRNRKNSDRFDRVVINPPFFMEGSGFTNKASLDQLARHDKSLPIGAWTAGTAKLLRTGGELYCVFPTERLAELCAALVKCDLQPKDIWWARTDKRRRRFFMRAVRGAKIGVIIHEFEGASKAVR